MEKESTNSTRNSDRTKPSGTPLIELLMRSFNDQTSDKSMEALDKSEIITKYRILKKDRD